MEMILPTSQPRVAQTLLTMLAATEPGSPLLWGHGLQDRIWSGIWARGEVESDRQTTPMTSASRPSYPGGNLGLPESGRGSLAPMGRRVVAIFIDWLIAYGLAALALGLGLISKEMLATSVLVIWFVLGVLAVRLFGFTPGQLVLGLGVVALDGRLGVGRLVVRGLLVGLVIPPLFTDSDGRGLQDRVTGTAVVRR
jgi:RDD family